MDISPGVFSEVHACQADLSDRWGRRVQLELKVTGCATRAQAHIRYIWPRMNSEQGKTAFIYYAPYKWEKNSRLS